MKSTACKSFSLTDKSIPILHGLPVGPGENLSLEQGLLVILPHHTGISVHNFQNGLCLPSDPMHFVVCVNEDLYQTTSSF